MTLVTHVRLNKTELFTRQLLYENAYGIRFDASTNMIDIELTTEYSVQVDNFISISTDSRIQLSMETDGLIAKTIEVRGLFLTYANLGKITIFRHPQVNRIPKVTIIYA